MKYYYLSIGSNIDPVANVPKIIGLLCRTFGETIVFPPTTTQPEELETESCFINSIAIVRSSQESRDVKKLLVEIEEHMGRNKRDPLSSKKDRTADIDIVSYCDVLSMTPLKGISEEYLKRVLDNALKRGSAYIKALPIDTPSTVDIDRRTGNVVVINKVPYPF